MKKLVLILFVMWLNLPADAHILTYNSQIRFYRALSGSQTTGYQLKDTGSKKFYLLIDVNDVNDYIQNLVVIDYYKDENQHKKYEIAAVTEPNWSYTDFNGVSEPNHKVPNSVSFIIASMVDPNRWIDAELLGYITEDVNIGKRLTGKSIQKNVVKIFKGSGVFEKNKNNLDYYALGSVYIKLDMGWTKKANNGDTYIGFNGDLNAFLAIDINTPEGLVEHLWHMGYRPYQ